LYNLKISIINMSLARFEILVSTDRNGGISKNGCIAWRRDGSQHQELRFIRDTTTFSSTTEKNAVIYSSGVYEQLDVQNKPLNGRLNIVISSRMRQQDHSSVA